MGRIKEPPFAEFVAIVAVVMGTTALGIDNVLPAFLPIGADFGVADENRLQLIVYVYMFGFAAMQLVYGPLADIIGRRPVLMIGFAVFALGGVMACLAPTFEILLGARLVQGMGAAAGRVLAVTIVRDRFEGREMARVMSLTVMIFLLVPVLAPATGSAILLVAPWEAIFLFMVLAAFAVMIWFGLRMPETLRPENRLPFSAGGIVNGMRLTVTTRVAIGYSTAVGLMFGCVIAYVGSAQQIFETEVYGLGGFFPLVFGGIAALMGVASFVNSVLVRRIGTRRMSHAGLCGSLAASSILLAFSIAYDGHPPLALFILLLATNQFLQSLAFPNFNAMAMQPLGAIAGTASSFIGFYTTLLGAGVGLIIGQAFDGTVVPLAAGFTVLMALGVAVVFWTERGRLFRPTVQADAAH